MPRSNSRGRFIVFEGGEGSGKSTQAALLAERMGALLTKEPGDTALGRQIRAMLLDPSLSSMEPRAEVLLFAAERAQHVEEVVQPALRAGRDVVCDRYIGSSVAYQGYGRGEDPHQPLVGLSGVTPEWVYEISRWASHDLYPNLTVLLSVPVAIRNERLAQRGGADRIEQAGQAFHDRVERGFVSQAKRDPLRWRTVDGVGTREQVAKRVADEVGSFFRYRAA